MIPASDHLRVWHQLNVFAHLNGNCLGSCCDGYFFYCTLNVLSTLLGQPGLYLNLSFQQPGPLLGSWLLLWTVVCGTELSEPCGAALVCLVYPVLLLLWFPVPSAGTQGHLRGFPLLFVEGWAAFSLCPLMARPLCSHSGISSSYGKDTNPIGLGPHPSDLI